MHATLQKALEASPAWQVQAMLVLQACASRIAELLPASAPMDP